MTCTWVRSSIGHADQHFATRRDTKSVLVPVPHIVAGARLLDLLPLLEADHRIQVVFTNPEDNDNWQATHDFLHAIGGTVLPWTQARRSEFDLVLAGSVRGLDHLTAPTLLIPHGGGLGQYRHWHPPGVATSPSQLRTGLGPDQLMHEGRVRVETIVLVHDRERELLADVCPQALPAAVVAGDIALDRLTASLPYRDHYRHAFGVADDQEVVVVTSTWSPHSAFGRYPDLFDRTTTELPRDHYRVLAALHPQIWAHHSPWQIRAWLAEARRTGLTLIPPDEGWRAALAAADHIIGDEGSVTGYGAATGASILLTHTPDRALMPGTPAAALAEHAPRWQRDQPLAPQLDAAARDRDKARLPDLIRGLLSSRQGQAGQILRRTMYHMLDLPEPAHAVAVSPVSVPPAVTL
ncbi:hypothetical protein Amsp01_090010 [Amycolatopsis sp. NBRC 101858]|uniref:hypothetical protein n=1 Tax=Amycolatopsis sp. NBRC 101858 TaxID=3032200 RepID=UPI0024A2B4B4|nr:hypothetical protein [Amycolatopsis sp. NBRC 101858]GLY42978.1 hypothetical protein Amsp01_090010 [Amycolatopsis sp. NBRC 101858]